MRLLYLLLLILPGMLSAATFTVNSNADTSDPGTLRWALEQHNDNGTSNLIVFDSSLSGQTITLSGTLPLVVFDSLTVDAVSAPGLSIDGVGRIFMVGNNADAFNVRNIRLQNSDGLFGGGCIRATGGGDTAIVVDRVIFANCEQRPNASIPAFGGAIYTEFGESGSLRILDSQFIGNRVYGSANLLFGGAVYSEGGSVRIERSRFELNSSENLGSAASLGGAIYISNAEAFLFDNEFLFNDALGSGGGAVALNLLPNSASFVRRNLFAGNAADFGSAVWTGTQVLGSDFPFFNFSNNTFLSNSSLGSVGGSIYVREGDLILGNNSFIQNSNAGGGASHLAYNQSGVNFLSVWNNLLGPTSAPACDTNTGSPAPFNSAGYNLLPDVSCSINGFDDTIAEAGPFLPLGNYGGPVRVVPPAHGNLAIDAANPDPITSTNAALCRPTDARGVDRPGDGDADGNPICDVGAFEWTNEAPFFFDSFEDAGLVFP